MWRLYARKSKLPDTVECAARVMRELPEGKRLGVAELTGAVRTTLAPHSGTTKAWEREFKNLFYWAMRMLTELGEVQPGPDHFVSFAEWFEASPKDPDILETERVQRRQEWLSNWWKRYWQDQVGD